MDLKSRRKELNLTLEEVGKKVGVGKSTVRKWENGYISNMGRDKIVSLARALQMNPLDILDPTGDLTKDTNERTFSDLKDIYNQLTPKRKDNVYTYSLNQLNEQQGSKKKVSKIINYYDIDIYGAVSAGTGEFLDDRKPEKVTINFEPPKHDFALKVNGDSMEPLFDDGQIIFVNKVMDDSLIRSNQIVIAELNGDAYVKKIVFEQVGCRLVSLNKKYDDIVVKESDDFCVRGLVVL